MTTTPGLAALDRGKYIRLTTFRRDGTPVPTPVWFAVDGDTLLVWTDAASGKAKRIRNDPRVELVACDARGNPKGELRTGQARLLSDGDDHRRAHDLLNRKYGVVKRAFELAGRVTRLVRRRPEGEDAVLAVTLDG